jgi:hypothetical protein
MKAITNIANAKPKPLLSGQTNKRKGNALYSPNLQARLFAVLVGLVLPKSLDCTCVVMRIIILTFRKIAYLPLSLLSSLSLRAFPRPPRVLRAPGRLPARRAPGRPTRPPGT